VSVVVPSSVIGQGQACINVSLIKDNITEDDQQFMIELSSSNGRIDSAFTLFTIVDTDGKWTFSLNIGV